MSELPKHIEAQFRHLIGQGLPVDKIAFMTGLSKERVEEEIRHLNTTKEQPR